MPKFIDLRLAWVAGLLLTGLWSQAWASAPPIYMALGPQVAPPQGYVQFCFRAPGYCANASKPPFQGDLVRAANSEFWRLVFNPIEPGAVGPRGLTPTTHALSPQLSRAESTLLADHAGDLLPLDETMWAQLVAVNQEVNSAVEPAEDRDLYGRSDYWSFPTTLRGRLLGDCEDYVLLKKKMLTERTGYKEAFSIALVRTPTGQNHAVLIVNTDSGEFVLDNLTPRMLLWTKTRYKLLLRQDPHDAGKWVSAAVKG